MAQLRASEEEMAIGQGRLKTGGRQRRRPGIHSLLSVAILTLALLPIAVLGLPSASSGPITGSPYLLAPRQEASVSPPAGNPDQPTCGFEGDEDTYGLGIRIGVYIQWLTSSLAYNFVPEEAITMRGVNNCFQAAMFVGLIYLTKTKGEELYAVEAFLMLLFCLGGVCSGNLYRTDDKTGEEKMVAKGFAEYGATTLGGFVRLFLGVAFCAYGVWFTFHGMDHMKHDGCSTYAFFLAKVNLYNWYRTFLKVLFVMGAVPSGLLTIMGIITLLITTIRFFNGGWRSLKNRADEDGGEPSFEKFSPTNLTFSGTLIVFIIAVELTIKWNKIQSVNSVQSTGQLLPVIIASGGVFRVLYRLTVNILNEIAKSTHT